MIHDMEKASKQREEHEEERAAQRQAIEDYYAKRAPTDSGAGADGVDLSALGISVKLNGLRINGSNRRCITSMQLGQKRDTAPHTLKSTRHDQEGGAPIKSIV